jgi:hypothetical protein
MVKPFTLKEGTMYRVGQNNIMHKCLTTLETHIVFKELHEGMVGRHFVANITINFFMDVGYWWPILFKDIHEFCRSYDNCQKIRGLKTKKFG